MVRVLTVRQAIPRMGMKFHVAFDDLGLEAGFISVIVLRDLGTVRSLYMAEPIRCRVKGRVVIERMRAAEENCQLTGKCLATE